MTPRGMRLAEKCVLTRFFRWRWHKHWPESHRESCERGQAFLAGKDMP